MVQKTHGLVLDINRSYDNVTIKGQNCKITLHSGIKVRSMVINGHNNGIYSADSLNGYSNEIESLSLTGHNNHVYPRVTKNLKVKGHNNYAHKQAAL